MTEWNSEPKEPDAAGNESQQEGSGYKAVFEAPVQPASGEIEGARGIEEQELGTSSEQDATLQESSTEPESSDRLPGQVTGEEGKVFKLGKYLGEGHTARVYLGEEISTGELAAIKLLRTEASRFTQDNFWNEGLVISELRSVGADSAPRLIDSQHSGDHPFLALEYIDAERYIPLDELLSRGPLDEQEALDSADQALDLLDRLHTRVERSYTDMQLRNFCWGTKEEGSKKKQLKVLDWNHVSSKKSEITANELKELNAKSFDELIQRNVARLGAYFFRMLTGKWASEGGETAAALEQKSGERIWKKLSLRSRQILLKALHPNPQQRYLDAASFRQNIRELQKLWQADAEAQEAFIGEFKDALKKAEEAGLRKDQIQKLERAEALLDLLEHKSAWDQAPRYRERLEEITDKVSAQWGLGKTYYENGQYYEAAQIWLEEAQAQGKLELMRRAKTARVLYEAGDLGNPEMRDRMEQALEAFKGGGYIQAKQILEGLQLTDPRPEAIEQLLADATTLLKLQEAEEEAESNDPKQWKEAARLYEEAIQESEKLPYVEFLGEEFDKKDLTRRSQVLRERYNNRAQSSSRRHEIEETLERDFQEGMKKLRLTLRQDATDEQLVQLCLDYGTSTSIFGLDQQVELLEAALLYSQVPGLEKQVQAAYQSVQQSIHQRTAENYLKELVKQCEKAIHQREWQELPALANQSPYRLKDSSDYQQLRERLEKALSEQIAVENPLAARALIRALVMLEDQGGLEERRAELDQLEVRIRQRNQENANLLRDKNLYAWRAWVDKCSNELQEQMKASHPDQIKNTIDWFKETLLPSGIKLAQSLSPDFTEEQAYIHWKEQTDAQLADLQAQLELVSAHHEELDGLLIAAQKEIGSLTKNDFLSGESKLKEVRDRLAKIQGSGVGRTTFANRLETLQRWADHVKENGLVDKAISIHDAIAQFDQVFWEQSDKIKAAYQDPNHPDQNKLAELDISHLPFNHLQESAELLIQLRNLAQKDVWAKEINLPDRAVYPGLEAIEARLGFWWRLKSPLSVGPSPWPIENGEKENKSKETAVEQAVVTLESGNAKLQSSLAQLDQLVASLTIFLQKASSAPPAPVKPETKSKRQGSGVLRYVLPVVLIIVCVVSAILIIKGLGTKPDKEITQSQSVVATQPVEQPVVTEAVEPTSTQEVEPQPTQIPQISGIQKLGARLSSDNSGPFASLPRLHIEIVETEESDLSVKFVEASLQTTDGQPVIALLYRGVVNDIQPTDENLLETLDIAVPVDSSSPAVWTPDLSSGALEDGSYTLFLAVSDSGDGWLACSEAFRFEIAKRKTSELPVQASFAPEAINLSSVLYDLPPLVITNTQNTESGWTVSVGEGQALQAQDPAGKSWPLYVLVYTGTLTSTVEGFQSTPVYSQTATAAITPTIVLEKNTWLVMPDAQQPPLQPETYRIVVATVEGGQEFKILSSYVLPQPVVVLKPVVRLQFLNASAIFDTQCAHPTWPPHTWTDSSDPKLDLIARGIKTAARGGIDYPSWILARLLGTREYYWFYWERSFNNLYYRSSDDSSRNNFLDFWQRIERSIPFVKQDPNCGD